jgi:predicted regulator of Ras-like GTPase activity (Roadblock/LC7/MglB family)
VTQPAEPAGQPLTLKRDRPESTFAVILRDFIEVHPVVHAAVFVDRDGECIDYATSLEPFDAQVIGAQLAQVTLDLVRRVPRWGAGALVLWVLEAGSREFVVRRVSDEHVVVAALARSGVNARLLRSMGALAEALRREGELRAAGWEPWGERFVVELRRSAGGWGYAPSAIGQASARQPVEVLGRWVERGSISAQEIVCFRVRCGPEELTLVYDRALDCWSRR